jgi:hypothetical protein
MLVNSIDPLAPYKVSDDLILQLVNVTALIRNDPEGVAAATCWIEIIEPHNLAKHQPPGGYLLDNRQVQMTCAKSAGVYEWMELLRTEYHSGRKQLNCFSHEPSER